METANGNAHEHLLMSKASSYHTADCFVIDGGYTAF